MAAKRSAGELVLLVFTVGLYAESALFVAHAFSHPSRKWSILAAGVLISALIARHGFRSRVAAPLQLFFALLALQLPLDTLSKGSWDVTSTVLTLLGTSWLIAIFRAKKQLDDPADAVRGLRMLALTNGEKLLALMELGFDEGAVTLVCSAEGDASLYMSNGTAMIGGGAHDAVRDAAIAFVREATQHVSTMSAPDDLNYPAAGNVRFYVRNQATLVASSELPEAVPNSFAPLFSAGQKVLTKLRESAPQYNPAPYGQT